MRGALRDATVALDRLHARPGAVEPDEALRLWQCMFEKRWTLANDVWITGTFEWFNATLATEVEQVYWTPQGLFYDRQTALTLPSVGIEVGW